MCNKKKYETKWEAKQALFKILATNKRSPWRDESTVYQCNSCGKYHLSSKPSDYVPVAMRERDYFDVQKEKWGSWLQKFSNKKGHVW
jgi:hypothetical protein